MLDNLLQALDLYNTSELVELLFGFFDFRQRLGLNCLFVPFFMTDKNECLNYPCLHGGSCRDTIGSFRCTCTQGWTGEICKDGKIFSYENIQYT